MPSRKTKRKKKGGLIATRAWLRENTRRGREATQAAIAAAATRIDAIAGSWYWAIESWEGAYVDAAPRVIEALTTGDALQELHKLTEQHDAPPGWARAEQALAALAELYIDPTRNAVPGLVTTARLTLTLEAAAERTNRPQLRVAAAALAAIVREQRPYVEWLRTALRDTLATPAVTQRLQQKLDVAAMPTVGRRLLVAPNGEVDGWMFLTEPPSLSTQAIALVQTALGGDEA